MIIFGIETSCDDTSICALDGKKILSLKTKSQSELHTIYGGVVPEIAARNHLSNIKELAIECVNESGMKEDDIDIIAVTNQPGLAGSLLVGVEFAKGMAMYLNKPIFFVNHLEGHIFTTSLVDNIEKDFYCLLVSGGHTQTIVVNNIKSYNIIGQTLDDSVGEGFDKISKAFNLGYPGGPIVEKMAENGDENKFKFSGKFIYHNKFDFSFSGLKTHFIRIIEKSEHDQQFIADICASFQKAVTDMIISRIKNMCQNDNYRLNKMAVCGGVSANLYIREKLQDFCDNHNIILYCAPLHLCTDNAAMIANVARIYNTSAC